MGLQASSLMATIAARTWGFICTVTDKNAPAPRTAPVNAAEQNAEPAAPPRSGAPSGAGGVDRLDGERRGAAGRARVAATQPGGGDHRCAQLGSTFRSAGAIPPSSLSHDLGRDLRVKATAARSLREP
jgi:hypothetical protein